MNRDELLEAVAQLLVWTPVTPRQLAVQILDTVEPLIRADEQKQYDLAMFSQYHRDWDAKMADLRAEVETLRTGVLLDNYDAALRDVLALLDGGSDDT